LRNQGSPETALKQDLERGKDEGRSLEYNMRILTGSEQVLREFKHNTPKNM